MGKMELSDQDSCLALTEPTVYTVRACLHIYGIFIGNRAAWSIMGVPAQEKIERKHSFSPLPEFLVYNGQASASQQGHAHRVAPRATRPF